MFIPTKKSLSFWLRNCRIHHLERTEKILPERNEERPTLKMILYELNKVLKSKHYKMQIKDPELESTVRYTPKITAWNI